MSRSARHSATAETKRRSSHPVLAALGSGLSVGLIALVSLVAVLGIIVPSVTGSTTYTILTQSMEPGLPPGTLVVVRPAPAADLRVGDVITFQAQPNQPDVITHRIHQVLIPATGERSFVTLGDNNAVVDQSPVKPEQIRGQVWYALPWLGWIATFRANSGVATAITIAGIALLAYGAWTMIALLGGRRRQRPHSAKAVSENN